VEQYKSCKGQSIKTRNEFVLLRDLHHIFPWLKLSFFLLFTEFPSNISCHCHGIFYKKCLAEVLHLPSLKLYNCNCVS
jgi:hypothetical protein